MTDYLSEMFRPPDRDNPPWWVLVARAERQAEMALAEAKAVSATQPPET